jgi:hypothetical protein
MKKVLSRSSKTSKPHRNRNAQKTRTLSPKQEAARDFENMITLGATQMQQERLDELQVDVSLTLVRQNTEAMKKFNASGLKPKWTRLNLGDKFSLYEG